jgi:hypothetical protein
VVACLWDPEQNSGRPIDLNTRTTVPDNGRLIRAHRVNDDGLILCEGYSDLGQKRVYLLTPYVSNHAPACVVPDRVLRSFSGSTYGVSLPCTGIGDIPMGIVPVSRLCQMAGGALDCPGCLRLVDAACGRWGIGVEGVPDGMGVTLMADLRDVGPFETAKPRHKGKPFTSKFGKRTLEIVFSPNGKKEYFVRFTGRKSTKAGIVFPIRITVFGAGNENAAPTKGAARKTSAARTRTRKTKRR